MFTYPYPSRKGCVCVCMHVFPLAEEPGQRGEGDWAEPSENSGDSAPFSGCSSMPLTACFSAAIVPWSSLWQSARGSKCTKNCVLIEGFTSDTDLKWGRNFLLLSQSKMHFAACEMLVITSYSYIILLFSIAACQSQVMFLGAERRQILGDDKKKKKATQSLADHTEV